MHTHNPWTPPVQRLSHGLLLLAGLLALSSLGHIFVPHSTAYWIGFALFVLLASAWPDCVPVKGSQPAETRRTRFFRLFAQGILLLTALIILDRVVDRVFELRNGAVFWTSLVVTMALLVSWRTIALTSIGQRVLSSIFVERAALAFCGLIAMLIGLELFVESDFSRFHVFGVWPTWEIMSDPRIEFKLNAAGYRDIEHSIEKQPGVTRILLIGDSVTAGYGVSQTDYYPILLREAARPSFEIIVAAQPTAETVHEIAFLRDYGCQFAPNIVVVGVFSNDPYLGLERNTPPWPPQYSYFKKLEASHSFNPDLIYMLDSTINSTASRFGQYNYDEWLDALYDPAQPWIELWHPVVKQLGDLARQCGARQLYAFTLPEPADYSNPAILGKFENIHTVLEEGFAQAGFTSTNLLPAYLEDFRDRPFRSLWAVPNDPHPNAEIHRWYAEEIWEKLGPELKDGE